MHCKSNSFLAQTVCLPQRPSASTMPPKRPARAKAKAHGGPASEDDVALAPPAASSGVAPVAAATANDLIAEAVSNAWTTIRRCEVFKDIDKAAPLGIDKTRGKLSGFKAS